MADAGVRIALLARAGTARDQLHRALEEAGGSIVAEGDPNELDPGEVAAQAPTVFLVSLEPAIESALERFDELLAAPGVEVMFDEAEVSSKLEGWDLNRWARHIASKLLGAEGLPPAPVGSNGFEEVHPGLAPGLPPTPAELMDHARLEDYTADTSELADWVPVSPSLTPDSEGQDASGTDGGDQSISWDASAGDSDEGEFHLDTDLGIDVDLSELDQATNGTPPTSFDPSGETGASSETPQSIRFSSFEKDEAVGEIGDLDADVAQLAAQLEAFEKTDKRSVAVDPVFTTAAAAEPAVSDKRAGKSKDPAPVESRSSGGREPASPSFDFSALSLAPADDAAPVVSTEPIVVKFTSKAPTMELSLASIDGDGAAPAAATPSAPSPAAAPSPATAVGGLGAVLVLAGLGGPDAVRQLLSSLPETLSVPVLLYQHLEVGKHERLVEQMAKISRLPVVLAREGMSPEAGKVTMLPAGMTAIAAGEALSFSVGPMSALISALPPAESMIIVLSGTDPQLVPEILAVKQAGGLVLAQDPEVCFDAVAADAIRRDGAGVFPALGLARQIATRWPN